MKDKTPTFKELVALMRLSRILANCPTRKQRRLEFRYHAKTMAHFSKQTESIWKKSLSFRNDPNKDFTWITRREKQHRIEIRNMLRRRSIFHLKQN